MASHRLLTKAIMSPFRASCERLFNYFDQNRDGQISLAELRSCLSIVGDELSLEEAEALVGSVVSDDDGLLRLEEFLKLVEMRDEAAEGDREIREAFRLYEMDGHGYITPRSLKRMLSSLGFSRNIEVCEGVISKFDINCDGVLSFEEFKAMMLA